MRIDLIDEQDGFEDRKVKLGVVKIMGTKRRIVKGIQIKKRLMKMVMTKLMGTRMRKPKMGKILCPLAKVV